MGTDSGTSARPRIEGADQNNLSEDVTRVLQGQIKKWGKPFASHLIYARRPEIYKGARGMWSGLAQSGLLDAALVALINRRVALLNGCVF